MHVDKSLLINFTCPGLAGSTTSQLELRQGAASSLFREICREKTVKIFHHDHFKNEKHVKEWRMENEMLESFITSFNLTASYDNTGMIHQIAGGREAQIMIEGNRKRRSCDHMYTISNII